ncbi:hypothetical protein NQZ79_g2423 [Umbelopsis isabellina]|nr:hypothetical protein NQZ79_g2423 [Umbelopsis isabellina]
MLARNIAKSQCLSSFRRQYATGFSGQQNRKAFKSVETQAKSLGKPTGRMQQDPYYLSKKITKLLNKDSLEEAVTAVKTSPISLQNEVVWNQLIAKHAKQGRSGAAFSLVTEMKRRGFIPTDQTFTSLLVALSKNPGDNVLQKANDLHASLSEAGQMSKYHYNSLLQVYARAGAHRQMMRVFHEMKSTTNRPDAFTYNIVLNSFARNDEGDFNELMEVWWQLQQQVREDSERAIGQSKTLSQSNELKTDHRLLAALLQGIRRTSTLSKQLYTGIATFDELHHLNISGRKSEHPGLNSQNSLQPDSISFHALLKLLNSARKFGMADTYIKSLYDQIEPDTPTINAVIAIRYSQKRYAEAVNLLDTMNDRAMAPNASTFDMLIRCCGNMYKGRYASDPVVWETMSKVLKRHAVEKADRIKKELPLKDLELSSKSCTEILRIGRAAAGGTNDTARRREIYDLTVSCIESQRWRRAVSKGWNERNDMLAKWMADAYTVLLDTSDSQAVSKDKLETWRENLELAEKLVNKQSSSSSASRL